VRWIREDVPLFISLRESAPYSRLAALRDRSHPPGSPQYVTKQRPFWGVFLWAEMDSDDTFFLKKYVTSRH